MDLIEAETLARELMGKHLSDCQIGKEWGFRWTNSKRNFGRCVERRGGGGRIELSEVFTRLNHVGQVRDTILHEIAHALAGCCNGHNDVWRRMALLVGAKPIRCCTRDVVIPKKPFKVVCLSCGKTVALLNKRKSMRGMTHKACNTVGKLVVLLNKSGPGA